MKIGVIGLGYVGLPLALAFAEEGHSVQGIDSDPRRAAALDQAQSYIEDVSSERLAAVSDRLSAGTRYAELADCDAVMIAVPTPLTRGAFSRAMVLPPIGSIC